VPSVAKEEVGSYTMEINPKTTTIPGCIALADKAAQKSGQDITHAAGCHAVITAGVDRIISVTVHNHSTCAF
jgi:hypothetical protein